MIYKDSAEREALEKVGGSMREAKFTIGTQFKTRGKAPRLCTVVDVLKTFNSAGELVSIRYVATHECLGQAVKDTDVVETTVAMGLLSVLA